MFKKITVFLAVAFLAMISANALDINNLNGGYYILAPDQEGDFVFVTNLRFSKVEKRGYSSEISYRVEADRSFDVNMFEFEEIDGEIYASLKNNSDSPVYLVTEKTDFSITMQNIDKPYDIIKLVLDKEYMNFKYEDYYDSIAHTKDGAMIERLHNLIDNQKVIGYTGARKAFFSTIDNVDGYVECVYTGRTLKTSGIPNSNDMNCEHSWPQSKFGGSDKGAKKCDIHHLFPTDSKANSRRSSYPIREVKNAKWSQGGSKLGTGVLGGTCFEPRDEHKGDVARAMFYFAVRYNMAIDAHQENTFRKWHKEDPVSEKEIRRNAGIEEAQGNRNPFIDRPEFVDNISDF